MTEPECTPLAVSMGEPAGIGTEILLKAYRHFVEHPPGKGPIFYTIDDPVRVERQARALGADVPVVTIDQPAVCAEQFRRGLPVLPLTGTDLASLTDVTPGRPSPATAPAVTASIRRGVLAAARGEACGLVTLPIQKEALVAAGFPHPGHTEFLGALTDDIEMPAGHERGPVMILTAGPFRVVPATVHTPLARVPEQLTPERILRVGRILHQALRRDYGIAAPRIAVAGLNPHAGENGLLGNEEKDVIIPALKTLQAEGIMAAGPFPADTMFHEEARAHYDAALTMYHDQGLIPIKTIAFHAAVNTTLGLPIVRTSPDHGTALDLVGKGVARADSLVNAIYSADRIARARTAYDAA